MRTTSTNRVPDQLREVASTGISASQFAGMPLGVLIARYPRLATIPRVALGAYPTPVQRVDDGAVERFLGAGGGPLWIKRDDLGAEPLGGNKVRSLEVLLAGVRAGGEVLTVGARASTHALATAVHAARLGAHTTVVRWSQDLNGDARRTAGRLASEARVIDAVTPVDALAVALVWRVARRPHWVPAGGTSPLGVLGHVNAALELAQQVRDGELPEPAEVVLPLGTGGTAAGLALGFAIAGVATRVVGARVVPRIVARRGRVLALAGRTARLIERATGTAVPRPEPDRVRIVHEVFGGAYGRATTQGDRAAGWMREATGIALDATYSAKAAAALRARGPGGGPTLFWLTFDSRWMHR
jgi:D-cysteine desulfhydrase